MIGVYHGNNYPSFHLRIGFGLEVADVSLRFLKFHYSRRDINASCPSCAHPQQIEIKVVPVDWLQSLAMDNADDHNMSTMAASHIFLLGCWGRQLPLRRPDLLPIHKIPKQHGDDCLRSSTSFCIITSTSKVVEPNESSGDLHVFLC
jgi:hypothetical protein